MTDSNPDNEKSIYSKIVIVSREGETDFVPFRPGQESMAEEYYNKVKDSWSDVYLCLVEKGPKV